MSNPIGVIWDVDGTLVDTAEMHFPGVGETRRGDREAVHT